MTGVTNLEFRIRAVFFTAITHSSLRCVLFKALVVGRKRFCSSVDAVYFVTQKFSGCLRMEGNEC